MKKSLIILILLTAVFLGGMGFTATTIFGSGPKVEITQCDLTGDPKMLEGLNIEFHSEALDHLHWNIDYTPHDQLKTKFHYGTQERYTAKQSRLLYESASFNTSVVGNDLQIDPEESPRDRLFFEVASHTAPGDVHTEDVLLSDFFDFYPFCANLDFVLPDGRNTLLYDWLEGSVHMSGTANLTSIEDEQIPRFLNQFMDAFRFSTDDDHKVKVTVYRNSEGAYEEFSTENLGDHPNIHTFSADTGDWVYFIIEYTSSMPFDPDVYAHTPNGYGVYRLPLKALDLLTIEDVEFVMPLDLSVQIGTLCTTEDQEQILLSSLDNGVPTLWVLDAKTGALLQRLETNLTADWEHEDYFSTPFIQDYDGFVVMSWYDDRLVLEQLADGSWRSRFHIPPVDIPELQFLNRWNDIDMTFDGQRLAVIYTGSRSNEQYPGNSFTLLIYDESGLTYSGYFYNSLDAGSDEGFDWRGIVKCNARGPHYIHWQV